MLEIWSQLGGRYRGYVVFIFLQFLYSVLLVYCELYQFISCYIMFIIVGFCCSELIHVIKAIAKQFHESSLDIILVIPPDKEEG